MLDEKTIIKMKRYSREVHEDAQDEETCRWFNKIEILLSIILEDVEDWMSESEVRNYEFTESGLDWLYWLPLDLKAKKEIIKDFEETYIREEKDAK